MLGLPDEHLAVFPEWETLPYEPIAPPVDLVARRMRALRRLADGDRTVLVTSIPAIIQGLLPSQVFAEACLGLRPNDTLGRNHLTSKLLQLGYRQGSVVEIPGEFSIRGGIVDIYSTAYQNPLRAEFLGDTVESLRLFDPATQQSTGSLGHAWILPARELIYPEGTPESLTPLPPDAEWRSPEVYGGMDLLTEYFAGSPILPPRVKKAYINPSGWIDISLLRVEVGQDEL